VVAPCNEAQDEVVRGVSNVTFAVMMWCVYCRHGSTGSTFSPQASVTSPPVTSPADYPSQVGLEQSSSSVRGLIDELNSLSGPTWPGHLITDSPQDGYDSADRYSWYPGPFIGRSIPNSEVDEKKWNENDNMADVGRQLDTYDSQNDRSSFPAEFDSSRNNQPILPTVEDIPHASPVDPPPPPPLPPTVLTPVPSTNFQLTGDGKKTFPVTVFGV